jgi:hypothetical protein
MNPFTYLAESQPRRDVDMLAVAFQTARTEREIYIALRALSVAHGKDLFPHLEHLAFMDYFAPGGELLPDAFDELQALAWEYIDVLAT